MGILQPETQLEWIFFSIVNFVLLGILMIYCVTTSWYTAFEAETFAEYAECFFVVLSASVVTMWYSLLIWNRNAYGNFFDRIDAMVEKSKHKMQSNYFQFDLPNEMRLFRNFE